MYYFYRFERGRERSITTLDEGLIVRNVTPVMTFDRTEEMGIGPLMHIYLEVLTFLKKGFSRVYREMQIVKNGTSRSKAVLVSKVPIYEFMPEDGIHICFFRTNPEDRGHGYYPQLLRYILSKYPDKDFYMIVDEVNIPSIKGIEKAGFVKYAEGDKVGKTFKISRYV